MDIADDFVEPYGSLKSGHPTLNGDPAGRCRLTISPGHTIIYAEVNPVCTIRSEPEATLLMLSASHVSSYRGECHRFAMWAS
jgi:hypothetical protein